MLTIRDEQLSAFAADAAEAFVRRAADEVARHWPRLARERGSDGLRALVRRAAAEAERFGLTFEVHVLRFVNLVAAFGEEFYRRPAGWWAARILSDTRLDPDTRLDLLVERGCEELRRLGAP
ncbi:MAG TPA: hypothetical protein VF746_08135 [Longimicrobium sp.]